MKEVMMISLGLGLLSVSLMVAWLDHKHSWQLTDWFQGTVKNPFTPCPEVAKSRNEQQKDRKITALEERIQVLEKIVTEPAYELNQQLNKLKD